LKRNPRGSDDRGYKEMNCEECQELLSDFLDGELTGEGHATLSVHLEECLSCLSARDELNSIVSFCRDCRGEELAAPPNERALWVRIRNTIEAEQGVAVAALAAPARNARRANRWSRIVDRSWELSFSQMTGAIAAIAIAVALATVFGMRSMQGTAAGTTDRQQTASATATGRAQQQQGESMTPAVADPDDRTRQQQLAIEYWNQRVEQRKARWNPQVREAFERNVSVLDQTVEDSRRVLSQNPHDEVYEEMLNTALNDKMELLKEFSDM
jgi:hypothetical protein